MPACRECGTVLPSAEIRKAPKGPLCKDRSACAARSERARGAGLRAGAIAACIAALLAVYLPNPSEGHRLPRPAKMSLKQREQLQRRTLAHDRGVARFFRRHPRLARTERGRRELSFHRAQARWTKRELAATLSALERLLIPHKAQWDCIHSYEGDWEDGGDPHWGGLQMDLSFARTYGPEFIRRYGEPRGSSGPNGWLNPWTPTEQMIAAERAHRGFAGHAGRGFYPWPNTARYCGLI